MNCQETREATAVALLTRATAPGSALAHAETCDACRSELAQLTVLPSLLDLVGDLPSTAVPPDEVALQRLLKAVRDEERPARRLRLVAGFAAAVLFVGVSAGWLAAATRHPDRTVHTYSAMSDVTGVTVTVNVSAAAAGSLLLISVSGVAPGTTCRLEVLTATGSRLTATTWLADYHGAAVVSTTVAAMPADISQVAVVDVATSRTLVTVPLTT